MSREHVPLRHLAAQARLHAIGSHHDEHAVADSNVRDLDGAEPLDDIPRDCAQRLQRRFVRSSLA